MSVYKRPDSPIWYYEFEHKGLRYRASTGQTNENDARAVEATARLRARQTAAGIAIEQPAASVTFQDWAEIFFAEHSKKLIRPERLEDLCRSALRFWGARPKNETTHAPARPYHNLRLIDVVHDPRWLTRWEAWLEMPKPDLRKTYGGEPARPPRQWSKQTRNHYRSWLSQLFHLAIHPKYREVTGLVTNPVAGMWRETVEGREVALTVPELQAVIGSGSFHLRLAVAIGMLAPKLREANILELEWKKHFTSDFAYLTVERHKTRHRTRKPLVAYVPEQLREILKAARHRSPNNPRVITYQNQPVKELRGAVKGAVERAAQLKGFRHLKYGRDVEGGITFHTLRHTAATVMAELDISPDKRQKVMAHADIQSTMRYTHMRPKHEAVAAEQLSDAVPIKALVLMPGKRPRKSGGKSGGTATEKVRKSPAKAKAPRSTKKKRLAS